MPFSLYAKFGLRVNKTEALATTYVGMWSTIPVPKIRDCIEYDGRTFLLMTKLPGEPVMGGLMDMSKHEIDAFVGTLTDWMNQLRALGPPDDHGVSHFDGGPCSAKRIHDGGQTCGPFSSVQDFHENLYQTVHWREDKGKLRQLAQKSHSRHHRICFTHNDLHRSNILVSNNRLTGLIDFERSGWYPEYWDFTTALYDIGYGQDLCYRAWIDVWERVFPQYHDEIQVEHAFWLASFPF